ncbi:hypothetical protein [Ornithinimicrobium flavum]|uniref:hypothetical protein n=1 Tax=Ornithinimicrobium flavum TaxID=1288636 RepID=UPI00106F701E|nr:hypothetical protein [Ornithinimicrobium flavum]
MSEHPTSPEQPEPEEGHFVGGDFGTSDNAEDDQLTTAPGTEVESVVEGEDLATTAEPSPGERNEPV